MFRTLLLLDTYVATDASSTSYLCMRFKNCAYYLR